MPFGTIIIINKSTVGGSMSTIAQTEGFLCRFFTYSDTALTPSSFKEAVTMAYSTHNLTEVQIQERIKNNIR